MTTQQVNKPPPTAFASWRAAMTRLVVTGLVVVVCVFGGVVGWLLSRQGGGPKGRDGSVYDVANVTSDVSKMAGLLDGLSAAAMQQQQQIFLRVAEDMVATPSIASRPAKVQPFPLPTGGEEEVTSFAQLQRGGSGPTQTTEVGETKAKDVRAVERPGEGPAATPTLSSRATPVNPKATSPLPSAASPQAASSSTATLRSVAAQGAPRASIADLVREYRTRQQEKEAIQGPSREPLR